MVGNVWSLRGDGKRKRKKASDRPILIIGGE